VTGAAYYLSQWKPRHGLRAEAAQRFPPVPQFPSHRARYNQKLIAERRDWPEGALQACWGLQHRHRGWDVSWMPENVTPGWERPAGFSAVYDHYAHRTEAFAPTVDEIESLLVEVPEHDYSVRGCEWCLARL
jgi:hypothetical protein